MGLKIDAKGREVMDPTPARPTIRREKAQGLADQMRSVVMQMQYEALMAQKDSEDDERDFEVDDDTFPKSPHELFQESPEYEILLADLQEFGKARKERLAREKSDRERSDGEADGDRRAGRGKKAKAAPEDDKGTE